MLVAALVGEKHRERYVHSSTFYAMVNALAEMMPLWVNGMAAASDAADDQQEAAMSALRDAPPLQPWTDLMLRSKLYAAALTPDPTMEQQ